MNDNRVIVVGEALIDLIAGPDGFFRAVPGGGPFNVARAVSRLEVSCSFLGALSTDAFGRRLRTALVADHVDVTLTHSTDAPTTMAIAELDASALATYQFYLEATAAAELRSSEIDPRLLSFARALHVGTLGLVMEPIGSTVEWLVGQLPADTLLMVDPNCRPGAIVDRASYIRRLRAVIARADIVKASSDDLAYLFPGLSTPAAAQEILGWGARLVIATAGPEPVSVAGPRGLTFELSVPHVQVVDTVGCGDAFGGAFLAWLARRGFRRTDLEDHGALREGVQEAISAAVITSQRTGADPPTSEELGTFMRLIADDDAPTP